MMDPKFAGKPLRAPYAVGRTDLDQMPDTPNRGSHHRRALSETFFRFPDVDDILLDDVVLQDFNLDLQDTPMNASAAASTTVDSSTKSDSSNGPEISRPRPKPPGPTTHFRSLSVGDDFFEGLGFASFGEDGPEPPEKRPLGRHRHSNSMDGSTATSFETDSTAMMVDSAKKAMGPDKLAELALIDPKRAKRILANRQSAARSKERKIRYTSELEKKVQTLQAEATNLSAQVTILQRDTSGLTTENKELKLRLQAMEQEAHLRDALNEALREEVHRLKIAAGEVQNGTNVNGTPLPQFSSRPQTFNCTRLY